MSSDTSFVSVLPLVGVVMRLTHLTTAILVSPVERLGGRGPPFAPRSDVQPELDTYGLGETELPLQDNLD